MPRRFIPQPIRMETLLREIEAGELALPEFQRSFVWEPDATAELIRSLLQDFPAGSLLMWTPDGIAMQTRAVENAPPITGRVARLVLDGQQRLTSLYQAFYGRSSYAYFLDLKELAKPEPDMERAVLPMQPALVQRERLTEDEVQYKSRLFPLSRLQQGRQGFSA